MSGTPKPCIDHGREIAGDGYARARRNGKQIGLHRAIFEATHGYLPLVVMHSCDNPRCIEITHLLPGTKGLNNADRASKGRNAVANPTLRKLTNDQVAQIRLRLSQRKESGYDKTNGPSALAREFAVDQSVISRLASGQNYKVPA